MHKMPLIFNRSVVVASVLLIFLVAMNSCRQKSSASNDSINIASTKIYTSEALGWQIEIPDSFQIISQDKMEAYDRQGQAIVGQTEEDYIEYDGLKYLISFGKDDFNIFAATAEPFELMYDGEYEDNNRLLNELIYQTFVNQGLTVDTVSGSIMIDQLEFMTFKTNIYSPDGDIIITQELFNRYINGYDFSVNLTYNNDADKTVILDAWEASTFEN
ncbi:MAG: hypothetical protein KDD32_06940 [Bacteroidetes bacterium]|nr:hypothetical protein [Bacteroidota bacterium]